MLIDTGAGISTIPQATYEKMADDVRPVLRPSRIKIFSGNGQRMTCLGVMDKELEIDGWSFMQKIYVIKEDCQGI